MQPLEVVLGVASLAFWVLLIVVIGKRVAAASKTPFLILQQFVASRRSEKGVYVTISGRPAGLISYIRSVLGFSQVVKFELTG